jgi:hypothetical protein
LVRVRRGGGAFLKRLSAMMVFFCFKAVVKTVLHGDSVEKREFLTSANLPTYFAKKGDYKVTI